MRDHDTTFDQLKSLRLVCRSFNYATAPRVLHCIRLFGLGECPMSNMRQFQAIVSPDPNGNLYVTKTLLMGNWKWEYDACRLFDSLKEMRNDGMWVSEIILYYVLLCLLMIIFEPHTVRFKLCIYDSVSSLCTRYHFSRASVLNMPNVRRVV